MKMRSTIKHGCYNSDQGLKNLRVMVKICSLLFQEQLHFFFLIYENLRCFLSSVWNVELHSKGKNVPYMLIKQCLRCHIDVIDIT